MSRSSRGCSGGGGFTFGCLVIIGVYAVLISVAFTIVTALYMTLETCEKIEADVAKVVKTTHIDVFNQDNSYNGAQETVDEGADTGAAGAGAGLGRHEHHVFCDCGTEGIWTFFEIIVLIAAVTGLLFMTVMIVGMCRGTFLKSRERRLKSEKDKQDKIRNDQEKEFVARVVSGELEIPTLNTGSKRPNENIELPS